uniref:Beta-lactamase-related domain-containing protein n=1 Tax=Rhizobium leguminosarum TaxID=384 RepID=A0A179BA27_RHILE|nr:hypothetical protein A4U53_10230 [Rhizobium leguminosarum]
MDVLGGVIEAETGVLLGEAGADGRGAPLLSTETVGMMMTDQAAGHRQRHEPGSGFGFGWSVINNPAEAGVPFPSGTLKWGGVYGHSWFIDPVNGLTVVALTNTTLEGMWGKFTVDLREAIYAACERPNQKKSPAIAGLLHSGSGDLSPS